MASTIYALATCTQRTSAIAIIRISGPHARLTLERMTRPSIHRTPPHRLTYARLHHPVTHDELDDCMCVHLPAPRTATGESIVELHVHGGRAVVSDVMDALGHMGETHRPAVAGEFTRRAYANGKMSLLQVEALGDLLNASTGRQRRSALRQMHGDGLARGLCDRWRALLLSAAAHVEAYIDFSEDDNIDKDVLREVRRDLQLLRDELCAHIGRSDRVRATFDGLSVCIVGQPNVGKSSLLNRILGCDRALVSDVAGTTRDALEAPVTFKGHRVTLVDTAGMRVTDDKIETMGIAKTQDALSMSDLAVVVIDASLHKSAVGWDAWIAEKVRRTLSFAQPSSSPSSFNLLIVLNKCDVHSAVNASTKLEIDGRPALIVKTSCLTGEGMTAVMDAIGEMCDTLTGEEEEEDEYTFTQTRQRTELSNAMESVTSALASLHDDHRLPLAAQHIAVAVKDIGHVVGQIRNEHVLDHIFKRFCIGK